MLTMYEQWRNLQGGGRGRGENVSPGSSGVGPYLEMGPLNSACFAT